MDTLGTSPKWYFIISSSLLLYGEEGERERKREEEREGEISIQSLPNTVVVLTKNPASLQPHSTYPHKHRHEYIYIHASQYMATCAHMCIWNTCTHISHIHSPLSWQLSLSVLGCTPWAGVVFLGARATGSLRSSLLWAGHRGPPHPLLHTLKAPDDIIITLKMLFCRAPRSLQPLLTLSATTFSL